MTMIDLGKVLAADFSPYLNQKFYIHYGETEQLEVELISVDILGKTPVGRMQQFSLIFQSGIQAYLPQGVFHISQQPMGSMEVLTIPIGANQRGMRYQVIFG